MTPCVQSQTFGRRVPTGFCRCACTPLGATLPKAALPGLGQLRPRAG